MRLLKPFLLTLIVTGCSETVANDVRALEALALAAKGGSSVTSDWGFPIADAGLAIKSDGQSSDGTYSWYRNGVCTVSSIINVNVTGDNIFSFSYPKTGKKPACGRAFTISFPDGISETLAYAGGVQVLQGLTFQIPIGAEVMRHMRFGAQDRGNPVEGRCSQGLVFGEGGANPALGSDSVLVKRVDARTWRVRSQLPPHNQAFCINNGQLYSMPLDFIIVANVNLP